MAVRAGAILALALVAGMAAAEDGTGMGEFKETDVGLAVTWTPGEGFLAGAYQVINTGDARLLVFDRVYTTNPTGQRTVLPDHAWRWQVADGGYVVAKVVPEIPAGTRVESPEVPYARILEPQSQLDGVVHLPLPLDQFLPYEDVSHPGQGGEVKRVSLWIGVAVMDAMVSGRPVKGEEAGVFSVPFDWARARQRILRSVPFEITLPMRRS